MSHNPPQVLIVDDDDDDREFFRRALKEVDPLAKLFSAASGAEGIDFLSCGKNFVPDFMFLDIHMPRMSGFDCLKKIRYELKMNDLPVIIFSTSDSDNDIRKAFQFGANLYIVKPSDYRSLVNTIGEVFSLRRNDCFPQPAWENFLLPPRYSGR